MFKFNVIFYRDTRKNTVLYPQIQNKDSKSFTKSLKQNKQGIAHIKVSQYINSQS